MKNQGLDHVPELRFPEFEGEWMEKLLQDLLIFKNGVNAAKEDYGRGYKFINVRDIIQNNFLTHDKVIDSVNISKEEFEKNIVEYGDILFQRSSETREEVGQANVYLDERHPVTFGGFVIRGKKKGEYNPAFMNYLLKTSKARKEITSKSGGSTRYNVGQDTLGSVKVITPTLPEQQKIAFFFTAIDQHIQLLTQKKAQLEAYKKGVMQKLFPRAGERVPELRFKDEEGKGFPAWEEKRLEEIGTFFSGGTPASTNKAYYNGSIPFIKSGEIHGSQTEQHLSEDGLNNSSAKMVNEGDLLMAIYGATSGQVSISKINGAINQAIICIRGDFINHFLFYWLTLNKKRITNKYLQGGQGNLSADIIKKVKFIAPKLEEQIRISKFLCSIDQSIMKVKFQLEQSQHFKKGLLQKMFV